MKQILAGLIFSGFVATGLVLAGAFGHGDERRRKAAVSVFLLYALGASFAAGLFQKNLWPFSDWPLIAGNIPRQISEMHLVGVDSAGAEHEIDYRAWEPMALRELGAWLTRVFPHIDSVEQDRAGRYLLQVAESARRQARAGDGIGYLDRYLGPLAAPYFILHPKRWSDPAVVPAAPFVRFRMYWETWDLVDRSRGPAPVTRREHYQWPR